MVKIEAVLQSCCLDPVKSALDGLEIEGITICPVLEHAGLLGPKATYRGSPYQVDTPRVKVEMIVPSYLAEEVVETLLQSAHSIVSGDAGTIVVYEVADAMRIRNGRRVQFALP